MLSDFFFFLFLKPKIEKKWWFFKKCIFIKHFKLSFSKGNVIFLALNKFDLAGLMEKKVSLDLKGCKLRI